MQRLENKSNLILPDDIFYYIENMFSSFSTQSRVMVSHLTTTRYKAVAAPWMCISLCEAKLQQPNATGGKRLRHNATEQEPEAW